MGNIWQGVPHEGAGRKTGQGYSCHRLEGKEKVGYGNIYCHNGIDWCYQRNCWCRVLVLDKGEGRQEENAI